MTTEMVFKHYIMFFSPLRLCLEPTLVRQSIQASLRLCAHLLVALTLHFSLTGCHTQQSSVITAGIGVDSLQIHKTEVQSFFVDSLIKEMFISADTVCMVSLPDQSTHLVAKGVKVTARKSKVKEEKAKVCIEDTTSLHIRDTTFVENKVDKQAIYEPPDMKTFFLFFGLMILVYLVFPRR